MFRTLGKSVWSGAALMLAGIISFNASPAKAATLTIGWDAETNPAVVGYVVSYGQQHGAYTVVVDAGNASVRSISGLADGVTYYFAVQAYDATGLRSSYSAEVVGSTPVAPPVSAPGMPTVVSPSSSSIGVATTSALSWTAATNAQQYNVALGLVSPPAIVSVGQAATSYQPTVPLMAGATYFWQVTAIGSGGSTAGPVWTFTTSPASSTSASPDGTLITEGGRIVDGSGDTWTIFNNLILKNGASVASWMGSKILWFSNGIYVLGNDRNWWLWSGSWTNVGPTQPNLVNPQIVNAPSVPAGPVPGSASTVDAASTPLQWTASTDATQYDVAFGTTNPPGTVSANQSATTFLATSLQRGSTYYWQITAKGAGGTTPGPVWSFSVPATAAIATFVGTDVITQGTWKGLYGRDGYAIAADATSLPNYVTLSQAGQLTWTFAASTTDARGLQKSATTDRIAAAWYGGQFSFDLDFVDGKAHDVAFYLVDWDLQNRDETISLVDSVSGAVLDSRRVTAFGSGQYWVWNVRGHVSVVTTANAVNALINGMFFDSAGGSVNQSPTVALTSPANGATTTAPATISLSATAADLDGFVSKVDFYAGPTLIGTVTSLPFAASWSNVPAGSYSFTAVATDNFGATTTSVAALVTVNGAKPKTASAVFAGTDATTQGTWKGKYGSGGYALANDATSLPSYASVSQLGVMSWTYTASTPDVRALQKATQTGRMAADWYGNTFTVDVNELDGLSHKVSLYLLDVDSNKRRQRIDIVDAATGVVLNSQNPTKFQNGQYWSWTISGHVLIRFTNAGGASPSAVYSGLFFDQ
jgi:Bacterial Ig domain